MISPVIIARHSALEPANEFEISVYFGNISVKISCFDRVKCIWNLYNEMIFPITNNILYLIYSLATMIIFPFIYAGGKKGEEVGAIAAYFLIFSVVIVLAAVEKHVRNRPEGERKWSNGLHNFSNNTFALNYMLTSIGYMQVIIEGYVFWYMYAGLCLVFLAALYFDFIKPLLIKIR